MKSKPLKIVNASENNLKNVNLEIPHDEFSVVTGLSGSGKSSLAFDTVYAEGQRRYIETFSPYTRQFFDKVKKPRVDTIQNVRPAVAIQQRTRITGSRSTVGSLTNILDYLKILWSNVSQPHCPVCGKILQCWRAETLAAYLIESLDISSGKSYLICAPIELSKKTVKGELLRLATLGFSRIYRQSDGVILNVEDLDERQLENEKQILVALDRIAGKLPSVDRLRDVAEQAFSLSLGICTLVEIHKKSGDKLVNYRNYFFCEDDQVGIEKAKPALFSFNHPYGACAECKGFGRILAIEPKLCVPNENLSLNQKALACWSGDAAAALMRSLAKFCKTQGINMDQPWKSLSEEAKFEIFNHKSKSFRGVFPWFKRLERKAYKMHVRVFLSRFRAQFTCPSCRGTRLKPAALAYRIDGKSLPDLQSMAIEELSSWLSKLHKNYEVGGKLTRELSYVFTSIIARLQCLERLGLPYLTLERQARTLSGGETQRVNLATAVGSELISTQFVLDEPSVGLHARDTRKLIEALHELNNRGNSLLVVEHDIDCIEAASNIIEIGPRAGDQGGQIVYSGSAKSWKGISSNNALLESSKKDIEGLPSLKVSHATARNLKDLDLEIPLSCFVVLTGVSGSGKSSLVNEVLKPAYDRYSLQLAAESEQNLVLGYEQISRLISIDQSPLSKTPRANIATYSKIWDEVRSMLAASEDSKIRAISKSSFSFNVDGGRCPACKGAGFITEDMQFLSDVYVPCEICLGRRFQEKILEIKLRGKSVHDLLTMTIQECSKFFHKDRRIAEAADLLCRLGLGHLTLGHPLSELSGGEAQRLKLVPFLQEAASDKSEKGNSLLIFDEPTTGLHATDVENLIVLLRDIRDRGHSILCIEHNLALIKASDWVIDLGPEGGNGGGHLVAAGTPEDIIAGRTLLNFSSHTAEALKATNPKKSKNSAFSIAKKNATSENLKIVGAKEHNLKNIDVSVPLHKVVTITGVSGSGKSSIAKDIIYAEGQRRFLDCLSPYARQFIKELKRPDIEHIENVQPTICVYQHTFQPSKLSTVATMSEVYNLLRLLYCKVGTQYCPDHPDQPISPLSAEEIAKLIKTYKVPNLRILAPVVKLKKGHHNEVFNRAANSEITEVRTDGLFGAPSKFLNALDKRKVHSIDYTVGKLNPSQVDLEMLTDAVSQAFSLGAGTLIIHSSEKEEVFSIDRTCSICKRGFFKPDPEDLSFNSKRGVCSACAGSGSAKNGKPCSVCAGTRLNEIGRNIRIGGKNIHETCLMPAPALKAFLEKINFDKKHLKVSEAVYFELLAKLDTLNNIGLDYLALDRDCSTLSSGELQRLRLATAMGSPLSGVMYIFDEPSAGLHPRDNLLILKKLAALRDSGNSVIMIEHDATSILASDYVIDVGPQGGSGGGQIVYSGKTTDFISSRESITACAIRESLHSPLLIAKTEITPTDSEIPTLSVKKSSKNNIRALSLSLPLRSLVCVAGVSGAGKSSLVHGIISDTINLGKGGKNKWNYLENQLESSLPIERAIFIDQRPIGVNSRSTPASYLGIWDEIRKVFALTIDAKTRGWKPNHFSYNTGNGRCPECKGQGQIKLEMNFLPDAYMLCENCKGTRFLEETKAIHYLGLSISDVLNLTFEEARPIFANHRKIYQALLLACEIGLGYLTLGQSSPTLSGGESQRIKLVAELSSPRRGHTLYILDEPTTGLHKLDVTRLIKILRDLVAKDNSIIVIEHDEDVILNSDYVLELGPGPGDDGGRVIFEGTAKELQKSKTPWGEIFKHGGVLKMQPVVP